jgi:hypothetical protein
VRGSSHANACASAGRNAFVGFTPTRPNQAGCLHHWRLQNQINYSEEIKQAVPIKFANEYYFFATTFTFLAASGFHLKN